MKSWRISGITLRERSPHLAVSTGTRRQPRRRCSSSRMTRSKSSRHSLRSFTSRGRNTIPTPYSPRGGSVMSSGSQTLRRNVELALRDGLSVQELRTLKDETLLWMLRELYTRNSTVAHLLNRLDARHLFRACYVLTTGVGEKRRVEIVGRFHHDLEAREAAETTIARASGIHPQESIT